MVDTQSGRHNAAVQGWSVAMRRRLAGRTVHADGDDDDRFPFDRKPICCMSFATVLSAAARVFTTSSSVVGSTNVSHVMLAKHGTDLLAQRSAAWLTARSPGLVREECCDAGSAFDLPVNACWCLSASTGTPHSTPTRPHLLDADCNCSLSQRESARIRNDSSDGECRTVDADKHQHVFTIRIHPQCC